MSTPRRFLARDVDLPSRVRDALTAHRAFHAHRDQGFILVVAEHLDAATRTLRSLSGPTATLTADRSIAGVNLSDAGTLTQHPVLAWFDRGDAEPIADATTGEVVAQWRWDETDRLMRVAELPTVEDAHPSLPVRSVA